MARIRHVYPSDRIPHLWAHQTQTDARNAQGNFFFTGDTIYSYGSHFPIAKHVTNKRGDKAVLLTTRSYSVTTSGHVSAVWAAIPKNVQVFRVYRPDHQPKTNLEAYLGDITITLNSARGRKMENTRARDVESATKQWNEAREFCKFFRLKTPPKPQFPKVDHEKALAQDRAIKDRGTKREAERRAEWAKQEAQRKADADTWNASGFCKHTPPHDANEYGQRRTCETQTEQEEWERDKDAIILRWRAGEDVRLRNKYSDPAMLRIRGDEVETSHGASVLVSHALRGLAFVRAVVKSGVEYVRNGHTLHLGHYAIDRVEANGTLHAGCHVISYAEIEAIAPQLEAREEVPA